MRIVTKLVWIGVIVSIACACSKQMQTITTPVEPATDKMEEVVVDLRSQSRVSAKENYENYCGSCHGKHMKAFVDRRWKHGNTKADLVRSITVGIEDEGMPAYDTTFTSIEVEELAQYILTGIEDRASFDVSSEQTPKYYNTSLLKLEVDTVVEGIEIPWGIKVSKDGTIYFTEREGTLKVKSVDGEIRNIQNVPNARNKGQGGMMDVTLDPNFEQNSILYLSYSKTKEIAGKDLATTAVVKAKLVNDRLTEVTEIFEAVPYLPTNHHYGSRLVFDRDGYLFITVGDRGRRNETPQSLSVSPGKVHRINSDGSIPSDNPFVGKNRAIPSIWSYGHRNPQGLVINLENGQVWDNEHGPRGGDELNLVKPGVNYGWPTVSYGINYNGTTFTEVTEQEGMNQPKTYWIPSIAPSGMAIVTGNNYPGWEGSILTGSLRFNYLSRVTVSGEEVTGEEMVLRDIGRVRSIEMGADGYIYVGVENPGRILKVTVTR